MRKLAYVSRPIVSRRSAAVAIVAGTLAATTPVAAQTIDLGTDSIGSVVNTTGATLAKVISQHSKLSVRARAFAGPEAWMPEVAAGRKKPLPANLDLRAVDLSVPISSTRIARQLLFVPPSMPVIDLFAKMQATRIHLALVIDEYGGTDGLVSIEDLVEEIVGDISDEHDAEETLVIDAPHVERLPPPEPTPPDPRHTLEETTTGTVIPPVDPPAPPTGGPEIGSTLLDGPLVAVIVVSPEYPLKAVVDGLDGHVTVRYDVTAIGTVANVVVLESSHRVFEAAATKATYRFRYKPRVVDGVAQETRDLRYRFVFRMEE